MYRILRPERFKMRKLRLVLLCLGTFLTSFNISAEEINMVNSKALVVYFSKTGEQYSVGNITEGNTAIVAKMIAEQTKAHLFEIKVKNDNYPLQYNALVEFAKKEKQEKARPELAVKIQDIAQYDTIFVGYPNWWADMPMPVYSFLESYDLKSKTIIPFVTHEGSGSSGTQSKIQIVTGANVLRAFDIYGHIAQKEQSEAKKKTDAWLNSIGF